MNRHLIFFAAVVALAGFTPSASALQQNAFHLGTEVYHFKYEEPGIMEDSGVFVGINGSYTRRFNGSDFFAPSYDGVSPDASWLLRLDGRFAYGEVDYTSTNTGKLDNIDDFVFETRLVTGHDFDVADEALLTPYIGLGYRYLNDDSSGRRSTTNAAGYERESNYFYMPIGVDFYAPMDNGWHFNANVEFDVFLLGKQKSHLGDAVAGLNSLSNDQEEGYGVRGSVRFTKTLEEAELFMEPFVRYWHVDDSDISAVTYNGVLVGYGLEPENKTLEAGARAGFRF